MDTGDWRSYFRTEQQFQEETADLEGRLWATDEVGTATEARLWSGSGTPNARASGTTAVTRQEEHEALSQ